MMIQISDTAALCIVGSQALNILLNGIMIVQGIKKLRALKRANGLVAEVQQSFVPVHPLELMTRADLMRATRPRGQA